MVLIGLGDWIRQGSDGSLVSGLEGVCVFVCVSVELVEVVVVPCPEKRIKDQEILELAPLWSALLLVWGFLIVWCLHSVV